MRLRGLRKRRLRVQRPRQQCPGAAGTHAGNPVAARRSHPVRACPLDGHTRRGAVPGGGPQPPTGRVPALADHLPGDRHLPAGVGAARPVGLHAGHRHGAGSRVDRQSVEPGRPGEHLPRASDEPAGAPDGAVRLDRTDHHFRSRAVRAAPAATEGTSRGAAPGSPGWASKHRLRPQTNTHLLPFARNAGRIPHQAPQLPRRWRVASRYREGADR